MTIEIDFFKQVMGQFTTGVTVVTTRSKDGLAGLTVNSFTSVSLDPPLVLICVDLYSTALPFFRASGNFAVNVLTSEQEDVSQPPQRSATSIFATQVTTLPPQALLFSTMRSHLLIAVL